MKKLLIVILFILLSNSNMANPISLDSALVLSNKIMVSRGYKEKTWVPSTSILRQRRAYAEGGAKAPAYYILHGSDGKGFVIVSADDCVRPILGFSPDGEFDPTGENLPPSMKEWLRSCEQQIYKVREYGVGQGEYLEQLWKSPSIGERKILLKTARWGQGVPFNQQCPYDNGERCLSGCVATAYAIVMRYYEQPEHGVGVTAKYTGKKNGITVEPRNLNHQYNWAQMPLDYIEGQYTQLQANCVSELMADIGAAIQADYSSAATSASLDTYGIVNHFTFNRGKRMDRNEHSEAEWHEKIKEELEKLHPILYRADDEIRTTGHAFIIDGYTSDRFYHINWGWNGLYNGDFTLDQLCPGESDYSSGHSMYTGCSPINNPSYPVIVNDEIPCISLSSAIALAPSDGTPTMIKLLSDFSDENIRIGTGVNAIIDLNGFQMTLLEYGIYNYGNLTIKNTGGNGRIVSTDNLALLQNYGVASIEGGEFLQLKQTEDNLDYRRCVWSSEESETYVKNGSFSSYGQVMCFKGDATISNGSFECKGNNAVISNYNTKGTLNISGGTFLNSCTHYDGVDYRRAIWTVEESETKITSGFFENSSTTQTLCFNGNATIAGGVIENKGSGIGCASNSKVAIYNTQIIAKRILYAWSGAELKCFGGLYSSLVLPEYLATGCFCTQNEDSATRDKYPYCVISTTEIGSYSIDRNYNNEIHYDLKGMHTEKETPGIHIIRKSNGRGEKVLF